MRNAARAVGLWLLLVLVLAGTRRAAAQSNGELHLDTQAGGYHVTVLTTPNPLAVGKIHILVRVGQPTEAGGEQPVRGATVMVRYVPLKVSAPIATHAAVPANMGAPGTYEADDELDSDGQWRAEITIDGTLGKAQTRFDFTAVKPLGDELPFGILFLAALAVGVITTIFFLTRYWSARQRADDAERTA